MKQLTKDIFMILGLLLFISSQSISQSKWAPIMMGDITTFVPNTPSVQAIKDYYVPNATVTVNVQGYLSGDRDWVGIFLKGSSNAWANVIKWKTVPNTGTVVIDNTQHVHNSDMPEGEYEVRLFFHNSYDVEASAGFTVQNEVENKYTKKGAYEPKRYPEVGLTNEDYVVYYPENNIKVDMPVVLFLEGGGAGPKIDNYRGIMKYLASHGYFVIGGETGAGYDIRNYVDIFESAINLAKNVHGLTINKLAVMGHSQGGGQAFYTMKYFQDKGYGNNGSLVMSLDGWFSFDMNKVDLNALKGDVAFVQMNGLEGTGTDPRIKLSIWSLASQTERKFLTLTQNDHGYVAGDFANILGKTDLIHIVGALCDDTFSGSSAGYTSIANARKATFNEIENALNSTDAYSADCAGVNYNAHSELDNYNINYCTAFKDIDPISTAKSTYNTKDTVSVNVQGELSGVEDWVAIFAKGSESRRSNIFAWNWVGEGTTALTLNKIDMPAGEYEVRLFFNGSYDVEESYGFSVIDNDLYIYPPNTTLTEVGVADLARPEKTAFEDITKASVIDPAFGTTITRINSGNSNYIYPKAPFWNTNMTYLYLGYRLFDADTLVESPITKPFKDNKDGMDKAFAKLGSPVSAFRWSNVEPKVFYTLQGENALTFKKNTIIGTDVEHEVLFDFRKKEFKNYDFELIQLGNGESHIDRYDKHVVFMAKKKNNNQMFAVLCNIQKPNEACKIKALEDSIWGNVHVDDTGNGTYETRSLFDWIAISPNGDHIVVNRTLNGAALVGKKVTRTEKAIYMYDLNFENRQKISNFAGHGDLGLDENGNQVYVQFEWLKGHKGVFSYNLDAPEGQRETKVLSSTYGGGHISCQNYKRPGWCYVSSKDYNEVFALKLDGSETVNRFVKARSTTGPYAGVSPDGKRVVYVSNWDEDNKSIYDTYHVGLKK